MGKIPYVKGETQNGWCCSVARRVLLVESVTVPSTGPTYVLPTTTATGGGAMAQWQSAVEFQVTTGTQSACSSCETVLVMKRDKNMTIPWQRGGDWKPILRLFFAPTPFAVCLLSSEGCFAPPCPLCRANFCFVVSSPEKLRQKGGPFWRAAISLSNPLAIRGSFHGSRLPQEVIPAFLNRLS